MLKQWLSLLTVRLSTFKSFGFYESVVQHKEKLLLIIKYSLLIINYILFVLFFCPKKNQKRTPENEYARFRKGYD